MKILIVGFGSIGRRHLRNLLALGESDIIVLRSGKSTLPVDELVGLTVEYEMEKALAHRPDAAIIANPTALHLGAAIPAARAGCHLFLEKPISHSLDGLTELRSALDQGGGQLLVGFQFRFHPGLKKVASLLAESAIGRVVSARAHWGEYLPNWHPWEDYRASYASLPDLGGGVALTLCHPFDYLRWLLGEVSGIQSLSGSLGGLGLNVEDTVECLLRFQSGAIGSLHLDYIQRPGVHRLEIIGERGTLTWDNADGAVRLSSANPDGSPGEWLVFSPPEDFERNTLFMDEMRHFLAVIRGEEAPLCTLEDGEATLRLALQARRN
jgi:predicted dehydrogenase